MVLLYTSTLVSLFFFFITFLLYVLNLTIRKRTKPYLPPSPPKLPLIGNLHQLGTLPHHSFRDLSLKYGPLLWLQLGQMPALLVSSAELARELSKNQDLAFANRFQPLSARTLLYGCKDIAFSPYGESWRQKRKICALELLSLKRVRSFQFIRDEEVATLVQKIRKACLKDKDEAGVSSVNVSELIITTSNNIMSRCIIGRRYDDSEDDHRSGRFGELLRKEIIYLAELSVGDLFPSLGWVDLLTGKVRELRDTFKALDAFLEQIIVDRKGMMKKKNDEKDFVDILLQLQDGHTLDFKPDQDDLKAILKDMFLAGGDTTPTTIEWTLVELMRNPSIMKKVQEEIRRVVGHNSKVDQNDINEMKCLKLVVKEALRLHPPGPFLVPRVTTCNTKVGGYDIPSKTVIYVNAWAIHRDPKLWERPEEFIPERFEDSKIDFKGQNFEFIPFGSGIRMCPGVAFGLASVEFVLANLLYWFDWKLPKTNTSKCEIDMTEEFGLTAKKKLPLLLQPIPYSL